MDDLTALEFHEEHHLEIALQNFARLWQASGDTSLPGAVGGLKNPTAGGGSVVAEVAPIVVPPPCGSLSKPINSRLQQCPTRGQGYD
jgi:hypothetical protein